MGTQVGLGGHRTPGRALAALVAGGDVDARAAADLRRRWPARREGSLASKPWGLSLTHCGRSAGDNVPCRSGTSCMFSHARQGCWRRAMLLRSAATGGARPPAWSVRTIACKHSDYSVNTPQPQGNVRPLAVADRARVFSAEDAADYVDGEAPARLAARHARRTRPRRRARVASRLACALAPSVRVVQRSSVR